MQNNFDWINSSPAVSSEPEGERDHQESLDIGRTMFGEWNPTPSREKKKTKKHLQNFLVKSCMHSFNGYSSLIKDYAYFGLVLFVCFLTWVTSLSWEGFLPMYLVVWGGDAYSLD